MCRGRADALFSPRLSRRLAPELPEEQAAAERRLNRSGHREWEPLGQEVRPEARTGHEQVKRQRIALRPQGSFGA